MKNIYILFLFYYLTGALYITNTNTINPVGNKIALEINSETNGLTSDTNLFSDESLFEVSEDQDSKHAIIALKTTSYRNFHHKTVHVFFIKHRCNTNTILNLYTNLPPPTFRI